MFKVNEMIKQCKDFLNIDSHYGVSKYETKLMFLKTFDLDNFH